MDEQFTNEILNKIKTSEQRKYFNLGYYLATYDRYIFILNKIECTEKDKIKDVINDTDIMLIFTSFKIEDENEDLKISRMARFKLSNEKIEIVNNLHNKLKKEMTEKFVNQLKEQEEKDNGKTAKN